MTVPSITLAPTLTALSCTPQARTSVMTLITPSWLSCILSYRELVICCCIMVRCVWACVYTAKQRVSTRLAAVHRMFMLMLVACTAQHSTASTVSSPNNLAGKRHVVSKVHVSRQLA